MSDEGFILRFESLEIPGREFRHIDHIRVAWIYLRSATLAEGAARFTVNFRGYLDHIGAQAKYHETITWFYLVVINERIRRSHAGSWDGFARDNADLLDPAMGVLRQRYGPESLGSPMAKSVFLLPG
jgi:hypothetical protein